MSMRSVLDAEFERMRDSRQQILDCIVAPHLRSDLVVLDVGCGPGFLARIVAARAAHVWGADISSGAIACARAINPAVGLEYIDASEGAYSEIGNGTVDLVYSFATIQHITDDIFADILDVCFAKLKVGGKGLVHVVVEDTAWKSEQEWRDDNTVRGRVKMRYGLNCFSRMRADVLRLVSNAGLTHGEISPIRSLTPDLQDDIATQHLLTFEKSQPSCA